MDEPGNPPERGAERISPGDTAAVEAKLRSLATLIGDSPHNLVSRNERPQVYQRHVLEAVAVGRALRPADGSRWLDLGTGGGLPGLPLALAWPQVEWVLLDATRKKVDEVRRFAAALALANVRAVHGRAEELHRDQRWRRSFDGVVSRAVARLGALALLSEPFLTTGGTLAAIKGPGWRDELEEALRVGLPGGLSPVSTAEVVGVVRPTWIVTMRLERPRAAARRAGRAVRGRRGGPR